MGSPEGQEVGVGDKREAPSLHDVPAHGVVGPRVADLGGILLGESVQVELVAQFLLAQHTGNEMLSPILRRG